MRQLLNKNGENQAVRMFLMHYGGCDSPTAKSMREHLRLAGFDGCWPDWAKQQDEHLTTSGAQDWLRHLFALEFFHD